MGILWGYYGDIMEILWGILWGYCGATMGILWGYYGGYCGDIIEDIMDVIMMEDIMKLL